jgi:hypothetical protein
METDVDFLAGQVHGLISAVLALISTHPDPATLERHLEAVNLAAQGRAGGEPVSDEFLEGMDDVAGRMKMTVEKARRRRQDPRNPR